MLLDNQLKTVDLVKVKSWQYTLLRAVREKLKRSHEITQGHAINVVQRMEELFLSMRMNQSFFESFKLIVNLFVTWLARDPYGKRLVLAQRSFPEAWMRFLQDCHLPEDETILELKLLDCEPPKALTPISVSKVLKSPNLNVTNNAPKKKRNKKKH